MIRFARPPAPKRPVSIELAAGIAVGEGLFGIITALFSAPPAGPGAGQIVVASIALQVVGIVVGFLMRSGRAWVVALNVAAIYAFLYLSAFPDPVSILLGVGQLFVVGALYFGPNRHWFDAMGEWRRTPGVEVPAAGPPASEDEDADEA